MTTCSDATGWCGDAARCGRCRLAARDPAFRTAFDAPASRPRPPAVGARPARTPLRVVSCKYAGAKTCTDCGSPDRQCDKGHGVIRLHDQCQTCDDYVRRTEPLPPWQIGALAAIAADPPPYPGGDGACVLTVGGGKYWPGVVVLVRMLRATGSALPVQVWYRGSVEEVRPGDVDGLGVELVDVEQIQAWRDRPPIGDQARLVGNPAVDKDGWRVKLFALARTQYERVLYLDADAYVVADPAPLLELAGEHGYVFWSDLSDGSARWWPQVWPAGGGQTVPVQGGQLALDRRRVWTEIALAAHMNWDAAHYYRHVHGDQDTWRVAFAVTGRPWHHLGKAPWEQVAFVCRLAGKPVVVHRVRTKMLRTRDVRNGHGEAHSKPHYHLPREAEAFTHFAAAIADEEPGEVFESIYRRDLWGGGSGAGSTDAESGPWVEVVNRVVRANGLRSVTDAGCGDGRVARRIDVERYTGVDVVAQVLDRNRIEQPGRAWVLADLADVDAIPGADLLLCKDVLHHWPSARIRDWLLGVTAAGRWRTLLVCVDREQRADGADCPLGGYRALDPNLDPLRPFGFQVVREFLHKTILALDLTGDGRTVAG